MRHDLRIFGVTTAAVLVLALLPVVVAAEEAPGPVQAERLDWRLAEAAVDPAGITEVQVHAHPGGLEAAMAAFTASGGEVTVVMGATFYGTVPAGGLNLLNADPRIRWVEPPTLVHPEAVAGEGVVFTDADDWHSAGYDGTGIKIGIVDTGFIGLTAAVANGDVPAAYSSMNYCSGGLQTGTDHGTAVAEIVHEIAPGADLYLACVEHTGHMQLAIDNFFGPNGVIVLNASLGTFNTGRGDGTGSLESLADDARADGILWVNSAGNYAESHWYGDLADGDVNGYHDFDGDNRLTFTLPNGGSAWVYLKWDDWGTWNGSSYSGSDCNLDLELDVQGGGSNPVATSTNLQTGTQEPTEEIEGSYTNTSGSAETIHVEIKKTSCSETPRIDLFVLSFTGSLSESERDGSITGLVPNSKVTAVGAVCVADASGGGTGIESYSSRGPTIDSRTKPDLSAPDAVSSFTYGDNTVPSCPSGTGVKSIPHPEGLGFTGTSAAAPHAAGAAALIAQAMGLTAQSTANAEALHTQLLAHTSDDTDGDGADDAYGEGYLDLGTPPVQLCNGLTPTVTMTPGVPYVDGSDVDDVVLGTSGDDTIETKGGNDTVCGGGGNDTIKTGAGIDVVYGGAGDDTIRLGARDDTAYGEDGEDVINGGGGADYMDGGADADTIWDSFGADVDVYGGPGDDKFVVGRGADSNTYDGGAGTDRIDYRSATAWVFVNLASDFASRNRNPMVTDYFSSIEEARGSKHDDSLYGSSGDDKLIGYNGDDELYGNAGGDNLIGDKGDDYLDGGPGWDRLVGGDYQETVGDECVNGENNLSCEIE